MKRLLAIFFASTLSTVVIVAAVLHFSGRVVITFESETGVPPVPPAPRNRTFEGPIWRKITGPGVRSKLLEAARLRPLEEGYRRADAGGSGYFRSHLGAKGDGKRLVFMSGTEGVLAIEAQSGTVVWTSEAWSIQNATISSGTLLVSTWHSTSPKLSALEAATGRTLWNASDLTDGGELADFNLKSLGPPVVSKSHAYVVAGGGNQYRCLGAARLVGVSLATGQKTLDTLVGQGRQSKIGGHLTVSDGVGYVGGCRTHLDPRLQAFELSSGERRWRTALGGSYGYDALVLSGLVITTDGEDQLRAFDRQVGVELWSAKVCQSECRTNHPALSGQQIIVTAEKRLIAIDGTNGQRDWARDLSRGKAVGPPTVASGKIYVASDEGVEAFSVKSGSPVWQRELPVAAPFEVTVADEDVFVVTDDSLECLSTKTGETRWRYQPEAGIHPQFSPVVAD